MTTNNKQYSLAEQNVYGMGDKDEKKAQIEQDTTKLKEFVTHYTQRTTDLRTQVNDLHAVFVERRDYYNNQLMQKENEIQKVQYSINDVETKEQQLKRNHAIEMDDLNEKYLRQYQTKEIELKLTTENFQNENDRLKAESRHVDNFGEREPVLMREIEDQKDKLEKEERALSEERLKFEKEKAEELAYFDEENCAIGDIKKNITNIEGETKEEKEQFECEKVEQLKHLDLLRSQRQKILEKNKSLKRDIQLNDDGLSEYQALNYQQAKQIKSLKMEVQYIKYRLSEELFKFTQEMEDLRRNRKESTYDLEMKIRKITEHIEQKNREGKNLKFLARAIQQQKGEVDQFFLDSIEYVKEQIRYQNDGSKKNNSKNQFPTTKRQINAFAMCLREPSNKPQLDPSKKVDISDLDWEEKEKIMRILYTKVNMGVTPGYWKHLTNIQKNKPIDANAEGYTEEEGYGFQE